MTMGYSASSGDQFSTPGFAMPYWSIQCIFCGGLMGYVYAEQAPTYEVVS